ncbi:hypothetical protein LTR94_034736, partial [Friedmanniomyces endolithicus]
VDWVTGLLRFARDNGLTRLEATPEGVKDWTDHVKALGVGMDQALTALETFSGIRRRLEVVGARNGVIVIDDFAHNPDKIAATLKTLHAFDGRLLILFQPHGFGPLKLMQREFIEGFAGLMRHDD